MAITDRKTVYPFAEMFRVKSEGTTAIDLMNIPAGTIVEHVLVKIETGAVGASNLTVGDDTTADGYIVAADATAADDTLYGEDPTERGSYLHDATKKGSFIKAYLTGGSLLQFVLSAIPTTEGVFDVIIMGKRFDVGD